MKKKTLLLIVNVVMISSILLFSQTFLATDDVPQLPHRFWGKAQDNSGKNIADGITIRAMIVDKDDGSIQNFTQLVYDGWYGWPLENDSRALYVESEGGDSGDPIYFYIGDINTSQSVDFVPGGATNFTLTISDIPRILADNSDTSGTTGDPFTFNVTVGEYVDSGDELTVKVNWTHGTHAGFVNNNDTMTFTGGNNANGFYFEKTIILDNYSTADLIYIIYVNDTSGNTISSGPYTVTVTDNDPPVTTLEIGKPVYPDGWINNSNVTSSTRFYLNATDNVGQYFIHYRIWNESDAWSTWVNGSSNTDLTFTLFGEGKHYIEYYSTDNVSNEETHHNITCWVDDTGPSVIISALSSYSNSNFTVSWSGTDTYSRVKNYTIQYKENSTGTWTDWLVNVSYTSAVWQIDNTTEGCTVYFRGKAFDNLGNEGSFSSNVSTTKDTTKPASTVNAVSSYWQNSTPLTITATASDNTSGVKNVTLYYYWNETSNNSADFEGPFEFGTDSSSPWSWNFNFTKGRGYYRFYSIAVDNADNEEDSPLTNDTGCYYNNTPPNTPASPNPANRTTFSTGNRPSTLSWTGGDSDNDTVTYTVYLKKGSSSFSSSNILANTTSTSCSVSVDWDSTYYWKVVATDEHGAITQGPIWWFKTGSQSSGGGTPPPPPPPPPVNYPPVADANGPYSGYVNDTISFDGSASYDSDGTITNYTWDFGDGTTGYGVNPTHAYTSAGTYTVTLTVKDNLGATGSNATTVVITERPSAGESPVADADGPYHGLTNQTIAFDGSNSYDPDGSIVNYTWDFGDGNTGYGVNPSHTYTSAGNYTVTLTVKDNDGLTNTTTTLATVEADSDNDGWSDEEEQEYGTDPNNATDYPEDTDNDHIPDIADKDDDNDGLPDNVEEEVGSDPDTGTEYTEPEIDGTSTYLVDTDGDGSYDTFYNPSTGTKTAVTQDENGNYLIDSDGDGETDYVYDPASGETNPYEEVTPSAGIPWPILVVLIIAILAIAAVAYLYRKGYF